MEKKIILTLEFQLRKPYNEADQLIDVFNQIIEEGGRCEICISNISPEGHILEIKMYRCRNGYTATGLGAKIVNQLSYKDKLNITKFNFASIQYCPVKFYIEKSENENRGQKILIDLYENLDKEIQINLYKHFALIDSTSSN